MLSGSIKVYLQDAQSQADTAFVASGANGLLFAADTADVATDGHFSETVESTTLLILPTLDGTEPEHQVLHDGACAGKDLLAV